MTRAKFLKLRIGDEVTLPNSKVNLSEHAFEITKRKTGRPVTYEATLTLYATNPKDWQYIGPKGTSTLLFCKKYGLTELLEVLEGGKSTRLGGTRITQKRPKAAPSRRLQKGKA